MLLTVARVVFALFSALLILGGIAGFLEKTSYISLVAGLVCGGLTGYAAYLITTKPSTALLIGLIGSILAGGGMGNRVKDKKTGEWHVWPAGIVLAASVLTDVVAVAGLLALRNRGGGGSVLPR